MHYIIDYLVPIWKPSGEPKRVFPKQKIKKSPLSFIKEKRKRKKS